MKIIATVVKHGVKIIKEYSCWDLYYEDTFNPDIDILEVQVIED